MRNTGTRLGECESFFRHMLPIVVWDTRSLFLADYIQNHGPVTKADFKQKWDEARNNPDTKKVRSFCPTSSTLIDILILSQLYNKLSAAAKAAAKSCAATTENENDDTEA